MALMLRNDFAIFEVNMAAGHLGSYAVPSTGIGPGVDSRRHAWAPAAASDGRRRRQA